MACTLLIFTSHVLPAHATVNSVVTHTVTVGSNPMDIAITSDGAKAVVANYNSASVSIIDTSLGTVLHTVTVNSKPAGVAISADDSTAYIAVEGTFGDPTTSQIVAISIATGTIAKTLSSTNGLPAYPTAIFISPDPNIIYAYTTVPAQWIAKVNLTTDTFTTYSFSGSSIADAALSPDGSRLIVIPMLASAATAVVNASTMAQISTVSLGKDCSSVAFNADGSTAYITHQNDDVISALTVTSLAVSTISSAGSQPGPLAVADTGTLYVGNYASGTLASISGGTASVVPGLGAPISVVLTPEQERVLVADYSGGTLSIIRTSSLEIETLAVGTNPYRVATANGIAVVANYGSSSTSIIRLGELPAGGDQVPTAPLQQYARAHDSDCGVEVPDSVIFPGVGEDQRYSAWGESWAQWPNSNTGGFVCTRQPYFTNSGRWSVQ